MTNQTFTFLDEAIHPIPQEVRYKHDVEGKNMLKAWREHLDISVLEMSERMEYTTFYYNLLESVPKVNPVLSPLLAKALGITEIQLNL